VPAQFSPASLPAVRALPDNCRCVHSICSRRVALCVNHTFACQERQKLLVPAHFPLPACPLFARSPTTADACTRSALVALLVSRLPAWLCTALLFPLPATVQAGQFFHRIKASTLGKFLVCRDTQMLFSAWRPCPHLQQRAVVVSQVQYLLRGQRRILERA